MDYVGHFRREVSAFQAAGHVAGPGTWAVQFGDDIVLLGAAHGHYDIEIAGSASDLALFLWQRVVTGNVEVRGDASLLSRYFVLVPPR